MDNLLNRESERFLLKVMISDIHCFDQLGANPLCHLWRQLDFVFDLVRDFGKQNLINQSRNLLFRFIRARLGSAMGNEGGNCRRGHGSSLGIDVQPRKHYTILIPINEPRPASF